MISRRILVGMCAGCAIATGATLHSQGSRGERGSQVSPAVAAKQEQAFRRGGLKAAAEVTGLYVRNINPKVDAFPETTKQLVALSSIIGIGSSTSNVSKIDATGRRIFTHYSVVLDRALKGTAQGPIDVAVEGGRVSFNGIRLTAQVNVRGARKPRDGVKYFWFLRQAPSGVEAGSTKTLVPVGDVLGIFDASQDHVAPAGRLDLPLLRRIATARMNTELFTTQITQATRK